MHIWNDISSGGLASPTTSNPIEVINNITHGAESIREDRSPELSIDGAPPAEGALTTTES